MKNAKEVALETLEMHFGSDFWQISPDDKKHIVNAMQEFSDRQLVQYKDKLIAKIKSI